MRIKAVIALGLAALFLTSACATSSSFTGPGGERRFSVEAIDLPSAQKEAARLCPHGYETITQQAPSVPAAALLIGPVATNATMTVRCTDTKDTVAAQVTPVSEPPCDTCKLHY